jgi:hypothetical protein
MGDLHLAVETLRGAGPRQGGGEGTSEAQCLERLNAFIRNRGIRPTGPDYALAQKHCAAGDLRAAVGALDGSARPPTQLSPQQCAERLDGLVRRRNLHPSDTALARARRACARGDLELAVRELREPR